MNETEAASLAKAIAGECIAVRVRLLNRVITSLYDRALQPLGLKANQGIMLVFLCMVGQATPGEVCKKLHMEKSTVSRNIDRMRKKGWVDVASQQEGVSQVIMVTAAGRELLAAAHVEWQKAQQQAKELIGSDGIAAVWTLHEGLKKNKGVG